MNTSVYFRAVADMCNLRGTTSPVMNSCTYEVTAWSLCYDSWKKIPGETGMFPETRSSYCVPEKMSAMWTSLSGDSCQHDTGAMCTGWHMVLGIFRDTWLAWSQVQCTALLGQTWATDTHSISFKILICCAKSATQAFFRWTHKHLWTDQDSQPQA